LSASRPPGRIQGDWLVATMIYASTREARSPGFDAWYWALLAQLAKCKKVLLIAGAYDSDGTIQELVDEARKRQKPVTLHFVERGPFAKAFELSHKNEAVTVEDVDTFAEQEGIELDGGEDELTFGF
jgi:hypothetical protein